jgi:glutathione synthase/RimK-type ligase-like ATP-grasp enzyme
MRIAFLVPAPDNPTEWRWAYDAQAQALQGAGMSVSPLPWTDAFGASGFDLVMPLVAWGYHRRYSEWLKLLASFERDSTPVANSPTLLRWSSDKSYLEELGESGVASVPSMTVSELDEPHLEEARAHFGCDTLVVKPLVSASAYGTYRLSRGEAVPDSVRGWRMLVQPWIEKITDSGEWSLMFFDGVFSHAVSKVPLPGEFRVQPEFGGLIQRCDPPPGAIALGEAALAAAPEPATYARVDIVEANGGTGLQVIELELIEPALFLDRAPERAPRFAEAVRSAVLRLAQ